MITQWEAKALFFTSSLIYNIISHLKSSVLPGFLLLSVNPKKQSQMCKKIYIQGIKSNF